MPLDLETTDGVNHRTIGILGVLTIFAYGSWYYSFGVLLDPIRIDTGWRESTPRHSLRARSWSGSPRSSVAACSTRLVTDRYF